LSGPEGLAAQRTRLKELGARLEGIYDEDNLKYTGPCKTTRRTSLRLRLLDGGPTGVLTAKGPAQFHRGVKIREETETTVLDAHAMNDLLESLGFRIAFSYRKDREIWRLDGVVVTLDVLDAGWFTEIEGPEERLEPVAIQLGLDPNEALKESYSALSKRHLDSLRKRRSA
jgi:predicted adenylyl cyclase CyaB